MKHLDYRHRVGRLPDWVVLLLIGPALPSVLVATGNWPSSSTAVGILAFVNICFCFWILRLLKPSRNDPEQ